MSDFIDIHRDHLTSQEVKKLCDDLKTDTVAALTLREVSVTDKDYKLLMAHVACARSVRHLSLGVGMVTDNYRIQLLALCVRKNTSLTGLFLHGNSLGDVGVKTLSPSLTSHPGIVALDVGDCGIGDDGLDIICGLLPDSSTRPGLRELVLSANPAITDKGWAKLSLALMPGTGRLRLLQVDYNDVTDVAGSCLLMGVVSSRSVETLDMECTGVTEATGKLLLTLLEQTPGLALRQVDLTDNAISQATLDAISLRLPGPGPGDDSARLHDFTSDDDHSLATSEPPLDEDDLIDDVSELGNVSELGDDALQVHPVNDENVDDNKDDTLKSDYRSTLTPEIRQESVEIPIETFDLIREVTKVLGHDAVPDKAKPRDKGRTKGSQSLADRIKISRPSSAVTQVQQNSDETPLRSASTGNTLASKIAQRKTLHHGTEKQPTAGGNKQHKNDIEGQGHAVQSRHNLSPFLIPETPNVVSLHKYQDGCRGQDNENFHPIKSLSSTRPRSAPMHPNQNPQKAKQVQRRTTKTLKNPEGIVMKNELQVYDTRRRLSCGSVLLTNHDKNRRHSSSTSSIQTFTRALTLQTSEERSQEESGTGSTDQENTHRCLSSANTGSTDQDNTHNTHRRLSSANIQPVGLSDHVLSTSAGSNSTLGDMQLEEIA